MSLKVSNTEGLRDNDLRVAEVTEDVQVIVSGLRRGEHGVRLEDGPLIKNNVILCRTWGGDKRRVVFWHI